MPPSPDLLESLRALIREEVATALRTQSTPPRVLTIRQACEQMAWTYSWAVRSWEQLGGFKDLDGKLKIRADALAKHPRKMLAQSDR